MQDDRSPEEKLADEEKKAHQDINRAHEVSQLLESKAFKEAVVAIMHRLAFDELPNCRSDEDRREVQAGMVMLNRLVKSLKEHMRTGRLAKESLIDIERRKRKRAA